MKRSKITVRYALDADGRNMWIAEYYGKGVAEVVPAGALTWFGFATRRGLKLEGCIASRLIVSIDF